jgi:pimeloyl-ACP methyl ester carboxylesterase
MSFAAKVCWLFGALTALQLLVGAALAESPTPTATDNPAESATKLELEPDSFEPLLLRLFFRYTGRGYHDKLIHYRLFVPVIANSAQKSPMIVWLHGLGDGGDDNESHLRYFESIIFRPPWRRERYPFFLLAVECPSGNRNWTTNSKNFNNADDMINVVLAVMEQTIHDYPIDRSRISLAGISSGGAGAWNLALRAPDRFSAVAPMACGGCESSRLDELRNVPVWSFISLNEEGSPVESARQTIAALNAAGGHAAFTGIETKEHDCWTAAFNDYDLLNWLLNQRRGKPLIHPPGAIPLRTRWRLFCATIGLSNWQPWQLLLEIGIPTLAVVAYISAKRQRLITSPSRERRSTRVQDV